jgi:hypothetical protein
MPKRVKRSNMEEIRPFCLFMLTGGIVTGTGLMSQERYWLGSVIAGGGMVGAFLLGFGAKILDWIEGYEYRASKMPRESIGKPE